MFSLYKAKSIIFFSEMPEIYSMAGMILVSVSCLFVFIREGVKKEPVAVKTILLS
jgi:drug/metabolite transporter (DMT)-like permease